MNNDPSISGHFMNVEIVSEKKIPQFSAKYFPPLLVSIMMVSTIIIDTIRGGFMRDTLYMSHPPLEPYNRVIFFVKARIVKSFFFNLSPLFMYGMTFCILVHSQDVCMHF